MWQLVRLCKKAARGLGRHYNADEISALTHWGDWSEIQQKYVTVRQMNGDEPAQLALRVTACWDFIGAWTDLHANVLPYAYITHARAEFFFFFFHSVIMDSTRCAHSLTLVSSSSQEWTKKTRVTAPPPTNHHTSPCDVVYKMTHWGRGPLDSQALPKHSRLESH